MTLSWDFGYPNKAPVILISEAKYQTLLDACSDDEEREKIEAKRERGEIIFSPYLPNAVDAIIFDPNGMVI